MSKASSGFWVLRLLVYLFFFALRCFHNHVTLTVYTEEEGREVGSFEVVFVLVFVHVQVAVRRGDLKEVSLCQTQFAGDVLPQRAQGIIIPKQTQGDGDYQ